MSPGPRAAAQRERPVLITGGCGFIGTNLAHRLLSEGRPVILFDNLARSGVVQNVQWIRERHGDRARFVPGDVRDEAAVREAVAGVSAVFHLAAQVAVTTSLDAPKEDFDVNAGGTLNVLEAVRRMRNPVPVVFTSTNKVYGALEDVALVGSPTRYDARDPGIREMGIGENRPLDFHSPYGCSKGAADQYVRDYARAFGIPTVVFRMSCIYGPHQMGNEDQGWVAHFVLRALARKPLTVYGDGRQVRDLLFARDLVDAFLLALEHAPSLGGQVFNIGGGPSRTASLLELVDLIGDLHGEKPAVQFSDWRTGDQRYYVSDTTRFREATGWAPRVTVRQGVAALSRWLLGPRAFAAPPAASRAKRPAVPVEAEAG